MMRCHLHVQIENFSNRNGNSTQPDQKGMAKGKRICRDTHEKRAMIRIKPFPISACEESILRVVVFDSTQTQASSKYFLKTSTDD